MSEKITTGQIIETIMDMLVKGELIASCYKCGYPISVDEVKKLDCEHCGKIEQDQIAFKSTKNVVLN
jgi:exosome complex RNA-binding protein Csl4